MVLGEPLFAIFLTMYVIIFFRRRNAIIVDLR